MFTSLSNTATVLVLTLRAELIVYTDDLSSVHKTVVHASDRIFTPIWHYTILSRVECSIEINYVTTMKSQHCTRQQTEVVELCITYNKTNFQYFHWRKQTNMIVKSKTVRNFWVVHMAKNVKKLENVAIANALQLEAIRRVLFHFTYNAMPSLKSLNAVL